MDLVFILLEGSQLALAVALFYCQCCQLATSGNNSYRNAICAPQGSYEICFLVLLGA